MGKYQNALDNLKHVINLFGANKYKEDLEVLQELINHRQSQEVTARQQAIEILQDTMLYGDFYYHMEDWLTECLCGNITELPFQMESEYLKCALRVEIKDYFEGVNTNYTDEDIENVVDRLFNHFSESVLNQEFIESETSRYIIERNNISMEDL
jgi:hypothetical protein